MNELPKIVLPDWSKQEKAEHVLTLKVFLTADCKVAGVQLEPEKGKEPEACLVGFKLASLQ
jgi:hypothetical protein